MKKTLLKRVRIGALLAPLVLFACDAARKSPPPAEASSARAAGAMVRVERGAPFAPACLIVELGTTVEWRNLSPHAALVVLSVRAPYELSSPSLRAPYNFVPPAQSDECDQRVNGVCVEPEPFSFWRHTFNAPGVFDYQDASGSAASGMLGDGDEYGLPPGPVVSASGGSGTVCVRGPGNDCEKVCCTGSQPDDCAPSVKCVAGRCGGVVP